jgi:hypothetical protein
LTDREEIPSATRSNFSNMRHVLHALYRFPLFSVFFSTTGKVPPFTSPDSKRISFRRFNHLQTLALTCWPTMYPSMAVGIWRALPMIRTLFTWVGPCKHCYCISHFCNIHHADVMFAATMILNADPSTQELTPDQALACLSQRLYLNAYQSISIRRPTSRLELHRGSRWKDTCESTLK